MLKIKDYIFNEHEISHIIQMWNENLTTEYLNIKSTKYFQPKYIIDKKGVVIKAYKYNKKTKEWERLSERNK